MQNLAGFASLGAPLISLVETSAPAGDALRWGLAAHFQRLPLHRGALIQGSLAKAPFVKFHKFGVAHSSTVCYTVLSDYSGDGR